MARCWGAMLRKIDNSSSLPEQRQSRDSWCERFCSRSYHRLEAQYRSLHLRRYSMRQQTLGTLYFHQHLFEFSPWFESSDLSQVCCQKSWTCADWVRGLCTGDSSWLLLPTCGCTRSRRSGSICSSSFFLKFLQGKSCTWLSLKEGFFDVSSFKI